VIVTAFEDWRLPDEPFDAVVSANAFHWLDPELRFSKAAAALRPGGVLCIGNAHHVQGGTPGFFEDSQEYYLAYGLSDDPFFQPPPAADAPVMYPELDERPEFGPVRRQRFEIPRQHTTESYVGWLRTDSMVSGLGGAERESFLRDIGRLIDTRHGGSIARNFVYEIVTAPRSAGNGS
jgi:SAM-dependent methyltransferase